MFEDEETSNQSPKNYFLNNLAMWIWMYINGSTLYLIDCVDLGGRRIIKKKIFAFPIFCLALFVYCMRLLYLCAFLYAFNIFSYLSHLTTQEEFLILEECFTLPCFFIILIFTRGIFNKVH